MSAGPMGEDVKAAEAARRDKTLRVGCPLCGQPVGARCVRLDTGQPTNLVHIARVSAWQQMREQEAGEG